MNKLIVLSIDGLSQFYLSKKNINMPTLRKLASSGGVVKTLQTSFPSVTWVAHSCVASGCDPQQTGVYGNTVYNTKNKVAYNYFDPQLASGTKLIQHKTIFETLNDAGHTVASICWPMTQGMNFIRYNIPEFYQQKFFEEHATSDLWVMLEESGIPVAEYAKWSSNHTMCHMQDELTTQIACYLMENTETNVLFLHYLLTDSYLHDYGEDSPEVEWACQYVDSLLEQLLQTAQSAYKEYDIMIFTDHGQSDIKQYFHANTALESVGLYCVEHPEDSNIISVSNGGCSFLYEINGTGRVGEALQELKKHDAVEDVWDEAKMLQLGYKRRDDEYDFLPNAIISYKDGICCSNIHNTQGTCSLPTKYKSTHGFSPKHDNMNGFLVVGGSHFKSGVEMQSAHLKDIAPTIAKMLSLDFSANGNPILELLQ